MAIPPADAEQAQTVRYFAAMRELLEKGRERYGGLDILSMGMSQDYAAAIAQGATIVRIGTAIYGPRDYGTK